MRNGFLGSIATLLAGAGLSLAQPVPETKSMPSPGQPLWAEPGNPHRADPPDVEDAPSYGPGPCPYHAWGSGEYLLWWVKSQRVPEPLATTGPASTLGILGQPGATILLGAGDLDYKEISGGRVMAGLWFDAGGHIGMEGGGFVLEHKPVGQIAASDANGDLLIGRPVVNALTGQEATDLIASPGQFTGGIAVTTSDQLWGAETSFVGSLFRAEWMTADMLLGFRYVGLREDLNIASTSTVLGGGVAAFNGATIGPGNTLNLVDRFETRDNFYGGQVGVRTEFHVQRIFVGFSGKLAFGNTHETVNVTGSSTLIAPDGTSITLPGGLLAVSSNSGKISRDEFTFIPEGAAKVGVNITDYVSVFVGYSFLYWFDVARPGDQINRTVNPTLVPTNLSFGQFTGPVQPTVPFQKTDYWAQGLTFGVEVRY